ncbi:MAG: hypothetical protein COX80_02120 [Candidatus Magasanikbacteria bacterium CG_4_10_14_0_2_um_filter_33_14]|uniref:Uncharacterized protein n=1 Tax=Candidatus Magasanikbacteria bacterium CG_4_10_14_0_2_um_filter_33_14 TaxID=1974636 RepID=A0A2M7VAZ0_9BACT|nr:MAG: hypothetical protein COX80_02120 [Candidatus Magasanikbacteria bacterium CG_4_10_14_0_2_um_filter_33_14]
MVRNLQEGGLEYSIIDFELKLLSLVKKYPVYSKEDFLWWSQHVEEDSINNEILKIKFPDENERKEIVKTLLELKKISKKKDIIN